MNRHSVILRSFYSLPKGCGLWGYGVRVRGGGAGGGVSPHMPLTGQKRKLCLMALPATACLLPKKKEEIKKINTKTKKTMEKEKECKKQAVHFALLFNFAAQRPDKLLSKFEMARLAKGDIFRQTFATCLCEITN